jgi:hypothetical protein
MPRTCEHCGKDFLALPSEVKRGGGKFCSRSCVDKHRSGDNSPFWRGGRYIDLHGYVMLYMPDNRAAGGSGYVAEHRVVMERALGHPIPDGMHVHHIDGNKANNELENLALMSRSEHRALHMKHQPPPMHDPEVRARLSATMRSRRPVITCQTCGKEFTIQPNEQGRRKFCSWDCRWKKNVA